MAGKVLLGANYRSRSRRLLKARALLLHALQFAFPSSDLALGGQELRALCQRDQLSELALLKTGAFDAVLKGVELAAQELLP